MEKYYCAKICSAPGVLLTITYVRNQSTSHHGIGTLAYAGMNVAGSHAWRSSLSPLATHPFYVAFYRHFPTSRWLCCSSSLIRLAKSQTHQVCRPLPSLRSPRSTSSPRLLLPPSPSRRKNSRAAQMLTKRILLCLLPPPRMRSTTFRLKRCSIASPSTPTGETWPRWPTSKSPSLPSSATLLSTADTIPSGA